MSGYKSPFSRVYGNFRQHFFASPGLERASVTTTPQEQKRLLQKDRLQDTQVAFPKHLFPPEGAQTIDLRKMCAVTPGAASQLFMTFNPSALGIKGGAFRFTHYAITGDGELATNFQFIPTVNGARVYPFHGDPDNNFRMNLGLAPDLSDNSLIAAELYILSTDVVRWFVVNTNTVEADMGVRMKGYLDTTQQTISARFGG